MCPEGPFSDLAKVMMILTYVCEHLILEQNFSKNIAKDNGGKY
jgi:hypothetical protein